MKFKILLLLGFFVAMFSSCGKDNPLPETSDTTVLVYMLANNSLSSYATNNIADMKTAATAANLKGGHFLIYYVGRSGLPKLIELKEDSKGTVIEHTVKEYDVTNSADPEVMSEVISDMKSNCPAKNYGLILWSHGTSWLPSDYRSHLRSFGQDGENWMEIDELAKGIPNNLFNFILFDACYMSSIECVYELKDKADYIMGSPTETMATGWPYPAIIPYFYKQSEPDLESVAKIFYDTYNDKSGDWRTATVSVVKTSELQALTDITKDILSSKSDAEIFATDRSKMQRLEFLYGSPGLLYDFDDYIKQLATADQYSAFKKALNKAITYEAHTPTAYFSALGYSYAIDVCSGLTVYVPRSEYPKMNAWYNSRVLWSSVYSK